MGIITAIKQFLRFLLFPSIYAGGIFITYCSIFKEALWGLFLLVILIPQPNIWYKFHSLPLGKDFLDIIYFAIIIGIFVQNKKSTSTSSPLIIILFMLWTYMALWNSSLRFGLPAPISSASYYLMDWKNFAQMIGFYFIIQAVVRNEEQQKTLFVLMAAVILFMAIRNYRNFSAGSSFHYDKREGGPFEVVGLGATVYGAFIAHFSVTFLGMSFFEHERKRKLLYLTAFLFCLHPLLFSYSRGAYLGFLLAIFFFGLLKKRILLVVLLIGAIFWQTILPESVVDRIAGTQTESGELESSANTRLKLWAQAETIISNNLVIGAGWEGFGLSIPKSERLLVGTQELTNPHNYFIETLCNFGVIGLFLLLLLFVKSFYSGYKLFKIGNSQFQKGLGFAFMGTILACIVTNLFGDRFSHFVIGSYFWILWGLVEKGLTISRLEKV